MYPVNENGLLILTDELGELLTRIQTRGNKEVRYQTDKKTYGYLVPEKWSYPKVDGLKFVGDCEDIAIYKHRLLIEAGVPAGPLLLTILKDDDGNGHCVLCVCTEEKDLFLDNNSEILRSVRMMKREGYIFLYRQGLNRKIDEPWDTIA